MGFPGKYNNIVIIFIVILIITFFIIHNQEQDNLYSESKFLMDTSVTIKFYANKKQSASIIQETFKVMENWAVILDRFNRDSVIYRINNNAGIRPVKVSVEVFRLLQLTVDYARLSDGAFDPTVAPLIDLWGFGKEKQKVPKQEDIHKTFKRIGYNKIKFNQEENTIYLPAGMELDLGAVAKGFIIDQGIDKLRELGVKSAYINGGGNIRVIGTKITGAPWHIGIRKPRQNAIYNQYKLELNQGSVATSGDYERYFVENGKRYSHLIDARTGYQARDFQAVTIYAPEALVADILSTVVFISGKEKGKQIINKLDGIEGLLVSEDNIWLSSHFEALLAN